MHVPCSEILFQQHVFRISALLGASFSLDVKAGSGYSSLPSQPPQDCLPRKNIIPFISKLCYICNLSGLHTYMFLSYGIRKNLFEDISEKYFVKWLLGRQRNRWQVNIKTCFLNVWNGLIGVRPFPLNRFRVTSRDLFYQTWDRGVRTVHTVGSHHCTPALSSSKSRN